MSLSGGLALALHGLLLAGAAVLLPGFADWAEARLGHRPVPPAFGFWHELRRLARKETLRERGAAGPAPLLPAARVGVLAVAALLVPSFAAPLPGAGLGDLPTVIGLLALARGLSALLALESGLGFAGVAAGRVVLLGAVGDGGLFLAGFAAAVPAGDAGFARLAAAPWPPAGWLFLTAALALLALLATGRGPFGGGAAAGAPAWGEAALAEAALGEAAGEFAGSGRDRALLRFGDGLRLVIWLDLLVCLLVPAGMVAPGAGAAGWAIALAAWAAKAALFTMGLGFAARGGRLSPHRARAAAGVAVVLALLAALAMLAARVPA